VRDHRTRVPPDRSPADKDIWACVAGGTAQEMADGTGEDAVVGRLAPMCVVL